MRVWRVWSSAVTAARAAAVFPEPASPLMTPRARSRADQGMPAAAAARPGRRSPAALRRVLVLVFLARGEGVVADPVPAGGFLVLGPDQAEVVDPGRPRGNVRLLWSRLRVGVTAGLLRHRGAVRPPVPADLQHRHVERVEDALDLPAGQGQVADLVEDTEQAE